MLRTILLLALAAVAFAAPSDVEDCPGDCGGCCPGTCSPCSACTCSPCCSGGNASFPDQGVEVMPGTKKVVIKSPSTAPICARVGGKKLCCADGVININDDQCSCKDGSTCNADIRKNEMKSALLSEPVSRLMTGITHTQSELCVKIKQTTKPLGWTLGDGVCTSDTCQQCSNYCSQNNFQAYCCDGKDNPGSGQVYCCCGQPGGTCGSDGNGECQINDCS